MKSKDIIVGIVDLAVWYLFTVYILYALKSVDVNLWWASLVILILGAVGTVLCPWFYHTDGWKRMCHGGKGE